LAAKFDVAVMHDFFVDRLVAAPSLGRLQRLVMAKAKSGGGGLHGIGQSEIRGGNAVNLAHALGKLGLRTLLITHSDASHLHLLRSTFEGLEVELRVKKAQAGLTVAFEERVNVMLGDARGAGNFGPEMLDESDWDSLRRSKVVCSVNWAANSRGTHLLRMLRKKLGKEATIFFDPADFRDRKREFRSVLSGIARARVADWVSMNREEGAAASSLMGLESSTGVRLCKELAQALGVVFDLHCEEAVYTSDGRTSSEAKVKGGKPRRLTGAGDVWDAGSIYGRLAGMEGTERLRFANAASRLYLESKEPVPPSLDQVLAAV